MLQFPDIPTYYEWVALIDDDSKRAKQHVISLKARGKKQGLMADPALTISIEDYARAHSLFDPQPITPQQTEHINSLKRRGLATLGPYPDIDDWRKLIEDDPAFAKQLSLALKAKCAMLGYQAPHAMIKSIQIYREVTGTKSSELGCGDTSESL